MQAEETMDWLNTEYDAALGCVGPSSGSIVPRDSHASNLDPTAQYQPSEELNEMQPPSLPPNPQQFAWSDFSPRSISDPSTVSAATAVASPSTESLLCKDFRTSEPSVGPLPSSAGPGNQLQLPSGFVGIDYPVPTTYIPSLPGAPSPQRFNPALSLLYSQQLPQKPLPPLPPKMKRGRGAPRKTAKAKAATVAAGVARTTPSEKPGVKSAAGRAAPAVSTEEKKRVRAERNRESAEKSRLRRKKYTEDLEKDVGSLRETNKTLKSRAERLLAMLHGVDADVERCVARGEGFPLIAPNGGPALKTALLALENVKRQCPMTFADSSTRVEIGASSASKGK